MKETVEHCAVCEERTPHVRGRSRLASRFSLLAVAVGPLLWAVGGDYWLLGPPLLLGGVFSLLCLRERFLGVACARCRHKRLSEVRRTKPSLSRSTEISLFS